MPNVDPRISVGQTGSALRCQRFAAKLLDPETPRPRTNEGAFRLSNAIAIAIADAHRQHDDTSGVSLLTALENSDPPHELGHEEAARFRIAIDTYSEQYASTDEHKICLHSRSEQKLEAKVGSYGTTLTGNVRMVFSKEPPSPHSGDILVRSVSVGPLGQGRDSNVLPIDALLRFALLGATQGTVQRLVVSPSGETSMSTAHATFAEIKTAFVDFGDYADRAIEAGERATATSGWWCSNCAFVRGCPAVSAERIQDLTEHYPGPATP